VNNSMGKRSAAAFKLKPTMAFAGQATVGAFVAFAATGSVYAQTGATPAAPSASQAAAGTGEAQQVVVTGIRRGIEAAISVKKNADQIVEAISSEDIGKLPDTTIAESLARLPGVTAQRDRDGKATNVSIRGLGPDFNGYLLNGREQTSTGDSRAVDLSVYPAELIAGATVYKTGDASLMTAGLAGTIDNKLIDPLMMPGRVIAVSGEKTETGRGVTGGVGHGNRYALTYVDQFADRKFGIALGFVHAFGRSNQVGAGNWGDGSHPTTLADGSVVKVPDTREGHAGEFVDPTLPGFGNGISVQNTHLRDDRDGMAGVLEFKPNPNFTSEIDFYHAKIFTTKKNTFVKAGFGGLPVTNATMSGNSISSGTIALPAPANNATGIIVDSENIMDNDTLQSFGWRNAVKLADTWRAVVDVSHNTAKRIEHDIEVYGQIADADSLTFSTPNGYGVPQLSLSNAAAYTDPSKIMLRNMGAGWSGNPAVAQDGYFKGPTTIDKIDALRADFTHDLPESAFTDLQFGLNVTKRTKDRTAIEALIIPADGSLNNPIAYPSGAYVDRNVGGTGLDVLTFDPTDSLLPGVALKSKYNDDILSKTWNVKENVSTAYAKLDIDTEMGKIPVRGNVGVQYVYTEQSSGGFRADIGSGVVLTNPAPNAMVAGTHYGNVLPSLNLSADLGDGNQLRFGAGIQIARSDLTSMRNSFTVSYDSTTSTDHPNGQMIGSSGNPYLKPFKAKALDLSYEKYFANKEGYVSAALFYKKLDTYIVPYTDTQYDFTQAAGAVGLTPPPGGTYIGQYTTSVNGHGGNLKGLELTAQLPFSMLTSWLTGFGLNASFSDTTSSVKMPNTIGLNPTQRPNAGSIPLLGLSHINDKLMLYYERAGFSAFIAQNSRSRYIGSVSNTTIGGYPTLTYIEPQKWVSAQVGYEVQSGWLKGLAVRLEGNNLNKPIYKESNTSGSITSTNKTGAAVDLRVSYKL